MELRDVTKTYQQGSRTVNAVRGVTLSVDAGEFVSIMGPSGSGKSTLLHLLGTLDTPSTGQAFFENRDLRSMSDKERSVLRRTKVGFVFQFFNLLPTLKGIDNVSLPLLLGRTNRKVALDLAQKSLERVGMSHRATHYPEEMSGGEMQRVAIARALVTNPSAILCDEPTGNLDSASSKEIMTLLRSLPEPGKRSVVMVTHERKAAEYGDRLIYIQDGTVANEERFRVPA
ncbi:ABC transporter ATP-binding protein [Telmatocola sphagniphila]|uniref:ABC transporter ATP-binding protein n=2 Tax=Telmatocola sphagniphila TaxID=1123043 RepID=A0A8E6BAM1_9BACT|nr:ABC transporter ATP-binding protein [Telmatocola sphagniphila]